MAKLTARVGFGELSDYEALDVTIAADEVVEQRIPAVKGTRNVNPGTGDPDGVVLGEDGNPVTEEYDAVPARYETQEEAFSRVLAQHLSIDDITKSGIDRISIAVDYSITGTIELEVEEYELSDYGLDDVDADDLSETRLLDAFEDQIQEMVLDEVKYGSADTDYNLSFEAE